VTVSDSGLITILYQGDNNIDTDTLELSPSTTGGASQWNRKPGSSNPGEPRYLPADCRD
jgi:hypothetical protein